MTKACPLPIDWLNFIEDQDDPELERHLESCLSCQALVTALKDEAAGDEFGDWLSRVDLSAAITFQPKKIERASFGELVLSASSYSDGDISYEGLDRVVFVVLDSGEQRSGHDWFRVAPADTDVENATSTDLVLRPSETELATPWRVLFAHQAVLQAAQLEASIGALTDAGKETLRRALTGELGDERFGVTLEGPSDPRLVAEKPIEELMRTLRAPFFAFEGDASTEQEATGVVVEGLEQAIAARARDVAVEAGGALVYFEPVRDYVSRLFDSNLEPALAAAMESDETTFWKLESSFGLIVGFFESALLDDRLEFVVQESHDFHANEIALVVHGRQRWFESEAFLPHRGARVVVAERAGFLDGEVETLAAKVK